MNDVAVNHYLAARNRRGSWKNMKYRGISWSSTENEKCELYVTPRIRVNEPEWANPFTCFSSPEWWVGLLSISVLGGKISGLSIGTNRTKLWIRVVLGTQRKGLLRCSKIESTSEKDKNTRSSPEEKRVSKTNDYTPWTHQTKESLFHYFVIPFIEA